MLKRLMTTTNTPALAIVRIALGIVILPHGLQKLLGLFGGGGFSGTVGFFRQTWDIPAAVTVLVILAESVGALALIAGFLSRVAALGIGIVMVGAVVIVHWQNGFFMSNGGYEFHILAIAMAAAVILQGGGALSVDRMLSEGGRQA
jgi:putative oxidoreductase